MSLVYVAMSGGVDSAAAALLLMQAGYQVRGVTLRLRADGQEDDLDSARAVADKLGIPHTVLDQRELFQHTVMDRFVSEYVAGRTPNPCVDCNRCVKFGALLDWALEQGADYLATGHYARVDRDPASGRYLLLRGLDRRKEQSYFLYQLTQHQLSHLLRELCKLDFHWIRLHYLYPDEITEELIDTIAEEPKIVKYLDIPIQHCNDGILKAMNRRDTKAELLDLLTKLRARIPGLVLRTSLITGLPGEGEAELEELCVFLRETKIERAGVFPFSPEEGTRAAQMDHVDMDEAKRRAELVVDVQSDIIDAYNESILGAEREVLCEGFDGQAQMYFGRSYAESPDIDGRIYFTAEGDVEPGTFVTVRLTGTMDGELTGEMEG